MAQALNIHYIYEHYDPETGEVVYIGRGSRGRAWNLPNTSPTRSEDHCVWGEEMFSRGYTPDQFVRIVERNLERPESIAVETELINLHRPRFNKIMGAKIMKITEELLEEAASLRSIGMTYQAAANQLGISTMTLYRGLNNRIPALEAMRARKA